MQSPGKHRWHVSALTLVGGAALAATPTAVLAVSSHTFSIRDQALIVVAVAIATFAGQLTSALTVESELAAGNPGHLLGSPRWLTILAVIAALALAVAPQSVVVACATLPLLFAALEVGRVVSVASKRDRIELQASGVFTAFLAVAVVLAILGQAWTFSIIAIGAAGVIIWRAMPTWRTQTPHAALQTRGWLGIDAVAAGITFPVVTSMLLVVAGAEVTAVFGMVASVSAIAALPGSYLKMRLLGEHNRQEIWLAMAAAVAATAALALAQWLGLINIVFGQSWVNGATVALLMTACAWRLASLCTVVPFASLRRHGKVRRMVPVRLLAAALTIALVTLFASSGALAAFVVLTVTEVATAAMYWLVDR